MRGLIWDIFCRVVDNFGDIGVCWRLAADLASRGHQVRLWVDDSTALEWMAPEAASGAFPGIQVLPWEKSLDAPLVRGLTASDVWIEAFGCDIAPEFIAACAHRTKPGGTLNTENPVWINLEYLSAEAYVERFHGLPSPVNHGPARGRIKHFFYPGFTAVTGGLIRERGLASRQENFSDIDRRAWLAAHGVEWQGEQLISLFCYEPAGLTAWLRSMADGKSATRLVVTAGRAARAVQAAGVPQSDTLQVDFLPLLSQPEYDELLWCCDLNMVRGEDSLVRALWAGKPLVWQIYPQNDDAHHAKLNAFLDMIDAPDSIRHFHRAWNGVPTSSGNALPVLALNAESLLQWHQSVTASRQRLLAEVDLTTQLIQFVQKNR